MQSAQEFLKLQSFMTSFSDKKILVIGDVILDRYVYGRADRLSREGPIPVFLEEQERYCLGGAGNTLANIAGLNGQAYFVGLCGDDSFGHKTKALLDGLGIDSKGLIMDSKRQSVLKTRYLVGHQQVFRSDREHSLEPLRSQVEQILDHVRDIMPSMNAVVFSDYGLKVLTSDLIEGIIKSASEHSVPVIVDPRGRDYGLYRGATAITPNLGELSLASGIQDLDSDEAIEEAAQKIIDAHNIGAVIATRSSKGMSVIHKDKPSVHVRPHKKVDVYDVSGAGDTVIACISLMLASSASYTEAAQLANVAGSIVVTKVGTTPIAFEELMLALQENPGTELPYRENDKIKGQSDWSAAQKVTESWKAKGLTVGFTNGCFDVLHSGHVTYLEEARQRCHKLIVGLNNDSSVKLLKGPQRPYHSQEERARVLAALSSADMVVLFGAESEGDDNTASALLTFLKPDVYFKGGDYSPETLPETPVVRAYGGRVEILSLVEGQSTTSSIERIKKAAS